jgi:enoyl-CoA hydratase/carnithine racemase
MRDKTYQLIRVEAADGVCTITLNNPDRRNAIGPVMVNELLHAFEDAALDDQVRAVVLTGEGKAFCAGGDLSQMRSGPTGADELPHKGDYADLLKAMVHMPKPIIAKVNGHAMGGGLGLVAASHFAIASLAAKLGTPEINVGLFPMMIMAVMRRLMPRRGMLEMMLYGERVTAEQAEDLGLVNAAVPVERLDEEVASVVQKIRSKSPIAIRMGLEAMTAQDDLELDKALPLLRERLAHVLSTEDAREGLAAFVEKREPVWKGK